METQEIEVITENLCAIYGCDLCPCWLRTKYGTTVVCKHECHLEYLRLIANKMKILDRFRSVDDLAFISAASVPHILHAAQRFGQRIPRA